VSEFYGRRIKPSWEADRLDRDDDDSDEDKARIITPDDVRIDSSNPSAAEATSLIYASLDVQQLQQPLLVLYHVID